MKKIFLLFISLYSLNIIGQTSSSTKALIDSSLPTNGVKAISATNLRTTLKAIVDYSDTKAPINNPTFTGTTSGITTNSINVNSELNLLGQKDGGNNNTRIQISNVGSGFDSNLSLTKQTFMPIGGWSFGDNILTVKESYFGFAGNSNPQANIDLGTSGTLKIGNYAGAGKVLVSDATGNATWSTSPLDAKQNTLTGTGFVKSTGGTISYDNSTYLTSSALSPYLTSSTASSTYATQENLALKANINGPTFTNGVTITGPPSNAILPGPFIYLNGGSGSSFSAIQQGIGTLDVYGFNGSNWINNLSVNNATGNVGVNVNNPLSKLHVNSLGSVNSWVTIGNGLGGTIIGHGADNEGIIGGYNATNLKFGYNVSSTFVETVRFNANGKNGFGTNNPQGIIDVVSTTSPSYPFPRMTTAQVNAITGMTAGAWVFDTTTNHPKYYNGSAWVQL